MSDQARRAEIRERLAGLVGKRVRFWYLNFMGEESASEATLAGPPEPFGFITASGGWARYGDGEPSFQVKIRRPKKRNLSMLRLDDCLRAEEVRL